MKNKFKAPIVEVKELSVINNIMEGGMLISANGTNDSSKITTVDVIINTDYKQWRKNR